MRHLKTSQLCRSTWRTKRLFENLRYIGSISWKLAPKNCYFWHTLEARSQTEQNSQFEDKWWLDVSAQSIMYRHHRNRLTNCQTYKNNHSSQSSTYVSCSYTRGKFFRWKFTFLIHIFYYLRFAFSLHILSQTRTSPHQRFTHITHYLTHRISNTNLVFLLHSCSTQKSSFFGRF